MVKLRSNCENGDCHFSAIGLITIRNHYTEVSEEQAEWLLSNLPGDFFPVESQDIESEESAPSHRRTSRSSQ